jgi:hypothetical protein
MPVKLAQIAVLNRCEASFRHSFFRTDEMISAVGVVDSAEINENWLP